LAEIFSFDFLSLFTLENLFAIVFGTMYGMAAGAMPGIGPTLAVTILIPLTFGMNLLPAVLMLVATFQGSEYGGSISSILLGIPGSPSASATLLDGYTMAKKGYPGKALGYSLMASFTGGLLGGIMMLLFMAPLARMAFKFSDPEIFLIAAFGLITIITIDSKDVTKSIMSVIIGLLLRTAGTDLLSGVDRFTFGIPSMYEGFAFVAVITGLFAVSEVLSMTGGDLGKSNVTDTKNLKVGISVKEYCAVIPTLLRSSTVGIIFGVIPGIGPTPAAWMAYNEAKRSQRSKAFGTGEPAGIVSCESANSACAGVSLLPLLAVGIPGSATIAVMASAFLIKGIQPGPQVLIKQPDLIYGILWGFILAVIAVLILGKLFTTLTARILIVPNYILLSIIVVAIIIGSYGARNNLFDVGVAIAIGPIAFILSKLNFSFPGFLMAFVLGEMIETSFRRSLTLARGSYSIFITRPISMVLVIMTLALIINTVYRAIKQGKRAA